MAPRRARVTGARALRTLRAPILLGAVVGAAWGAGIVAPAAALFALGWLVIVAAWVLQAWWRSTERWTGAVLRRGLTEDAAHWLVDVPASRAAAAERLAHGLAAAGARATFFVPPGASELARRLAAAGQGVAWLGVPGTRADGGGERLPFWRPAGFGAGRREFERAATLGLAAVAPTLPLPAAPSRTEPVATDLVLVPLPLTDRTLATWLEDHEQRAIRLTPLGSA